MPLSSPLLSWPYRFSIPGYFASSSWRGTKASPSQELRVSVDGRNDSGAGVNTSVDGLVSTFQGTPVKAHSVSNSQDCVYRQSAVGTTILEQLRLRSEAFFISNSVSI